MSAYLKIKCKKVVYDDFLVDIVGFELNLKKLSDNATRTNFFNYMLLYMYKLNR